MQILLEHTKEMYPPESIALKIITNNTDRFNCLYPYIIICRGNFNRVRLLVYILMLLCCRLVECSRLFYVGIPLGFGFRKFIVEIIVCV